MIELTFTHDEDEYVDAVRWFYARVYHTRFLMLFSAGVMLLGVVFALLGFEFVFSGVAAILGLLLFLRNAYPYFVMPKQQFRRYTRFQDEYTLQFMEEGLRFQTKSTDSKLAWSFYSSVLEAPKYYLLRYEKDLFTLIPKRAFVDKQQEAAFRDLLNRKLGANLDSQNFGYGSNGSSSYTFRSPQGPPDWR